MHPKTHLCCFGCGEKWCTKTMDHNPPMGFDSVSLEWLIASAKFKSSPSGRGGIKSRIGKWVQGSRLLDSFMLVMNAGLSVPTVASVGDHSKMWWQMSVMAHTSPRVYPCTPEIFQTKHKTCITCISNPSLNHPKLLFANPLIYFSSIWNPFKANPNVDRRCRVRCSFFSRSCWDFSSSVNSGL